MPNGTTQEEKSLVVRWLVPMAFALGLLLISAPYWLKVECPEHPKLTIIAGRGFELGSKLGDAFVIASVLAVIVDIGTKRRLVQEVVQAASPKLIAPHLPQSVQDALLGYFKINFLRPEWEVEYELTPIPGRNGFLKISSRVKGVVQNTSVKTEEFAFIGSADPSYAPADLGTSSITRVAMAAELGATLFDENPGDSQEILQSDGSLLFKKTIALQAGCRYTTIFECIEYGANSISLPLFSSTTAVKTLVRIRYPKDELEVTLQLPNGSAEAISEDLTQWGKEWRIETPLFPGHCILTTVIPKKQTSPFVSKDAETNLR